MEPLMEMDVTNLDELRSSEPRDDEPAEPVRRFYGKYRGTVLSNTDPERRGRLLVQVPDVSGLFPATWALPCAPLSGIQTGVFTLPPPGAKVWVEFEHGDPDFPIVAGGFWGLIAEVPALAQLVPPIVPAPPTIALQTPGVSGFHGVLVSTLAGPLPSGGVLLQSGPSSVAVTPQGVVIVAPQVSIIGPTSINGDALVVAL
jgi:hypothetical protein